MDDKRIIDARGLSCPQPVMLVRKALVEAGEGEIAALLDTMTSVQNCIRAAKSLGWNTEWTEKDGIYHLTFKK